MHGLAERLRSRLAWGLVTDIQMPSYETKIEILHKKAQTQNQHLSDEVMHFIACQHHTSVREIEGALVRVVAYATLMNQHITLEMAQKALNKSDSSSISHVTTDLYRSIDMDHVLHVVSEQFSCSLTELRSKSKGRQISQARHVAMYLLKKCTRKSLHEIALFLRRQDHTTVLHGCRQVEQRMQESEDFANSIKALEEKIII